MDMHGWQEKQPISDSRSWIEHYRTNAACLRTVPWDAGREITDSEREAIRKSIQAFQLGESSEGRHLRKCAKVWGDRTGDPAYSDAIRLFILEEQRHSRELGRFMDLNGIPRVAKVGTDTLFRAVRRAAGLELSIMVLVTAEIVAQVYYVALRESTRSTALRSICTQILHDEEHHVRFQCERLALFASRRSWLQLAIRRTFQRFLMVATLPIVWASHRRAYQAGGYPFSRYVSETWLAFHQALIRMHPLSYAWESPHAAQQLLTGRHPN